MGYKRNGISCILCGNKETVGRKLCRPCYRHHYNKGTLHKFKQVGPEDVFLGRVTKTGTCWIWQGTKNGHGYGIVLLPGERPVRAHRFSYEMLVGKIPEGKIILHTCDNPPCVNPKHLRLGTRDDNNKDTAIKRRHNYGLDHWNGKLSDADVLEIRSSTQKQSELAKKYGVSQSHISHLKRGKHRRIA